MTKTALMLSDESPVEAAARRALLQRAATGLKIISEAHRYKWTCCWQSFTVPDRGFGDERWIWEMCRGDGPGDSYRTWPPPRDCNHWHHWHEPPPIA